MTPAGMSQVEAARADGRWSAAYEGSAAMVFPDALAALPEAGAFYRTLDCKNLYPIYHAFRWRSGRRREPADSSSSSSSSCEASASTDPEAVLEVHG